MRVILDLKYEIPLDSRIIKWFNGFGFPIKLEARMLMSIDLYEFIEDTIQELCKRANVYPTILDACIFSSFSAPCRTLPKGFLRRNRRPAD